MIGVLERGVVWWSEGGMGRVGEVLITFTYYYGNRELT